jgi:protein TonB
VTPAILLADRDDKVTAAPAEPLGPPPARAPGGQRKWRLALAASCIFHAAAALFFLQANDEGVLIEGAESSGIAFLGDAAEDQISAGSEAVEAVNVTMIAMLEAKPVEIVAAKKVTVSDTTDSVEAVSADRSEIERLAPIEERVAERVQAAEAVPTEAAEPAEPVQAEAEPAQPVAELAPEILATERIEPVTDVVAPVVEVPAQAEAVEASGAETVETAATAPVEAAERAEATPVEPAVAALPDPLPVANPVEKAATAKPVKQVEKKDAAQPKPAKPEKAKPAKKPEEKTGAKGTGSGGSNEADARKGHADGRANGAAASKGGKSSAGNAALSNYPGKVAAKLRRALRYPAEAKRQKLRGQVRVGFVVSAGGGVGSIRVVSSSGSPVLDRAALETVRRAAPFPPIPEGAARSQWPFTVPLAFSR